MHQQCAEALVVIHSAHRCVPESALIALLSHPNSKVVNMIVRLVGDLKIKEALPALKQLEHRSVNRIAVSEAIEKLTGE